MSNAVSTSVSGLLAFKRAIDVHSQNVANVNTAGYVRRTVELETRSGTGAAGQVVGSGVEVARVRRLVNEYLIDQSRTARSAARTVASSDPTSGNRRTARPVAVPRS